MKNFFSIALIALFSAFISQAETKIAIVDFMKVAEQLPEVQDFNKDMQKQQGMYMDTLSQRQQQLEVQIAEFQKNSGMMTEEMKQQKTAELAASRQQLMVYQESKLGQQGELAQKQQKFLMEIRDVIVNAISEIAKKEKFNLVLEKSNALYSQDSMDITFTVIDRLKRGAN
ncbi:MAG: OmpH family outer membrane protein [Candidatus Kapaibacteriales bacterium]